MSLTRIYLILCFVAAILSSTAAQAGDQTVYELRTYTTYDGRLGALHKRFTEHTMKLFAKHGIRSIGYWVPTDPEKSRNTLIYIVAHESAEAAKANWEAFGRDPQWQKVYKDSHKDGGPIVKSVESVFMSATDYSPLEQK